MTTGNLATYKLANGRHRPLGLRDKVEQLAGHLTRELIDAIRMTAEAPPHSYTQGRYAERAATLRRILDDLERIVGHQS